MMNAQQAAAQHAKIVGLVVEALPFLTLWASHPRTCSSDECQQTAIWAVALPTSDGEVNEYTFCTDHLLGLILLGSQTGVSEDGIQI